MSREKLYTFTVPVTIFAVRTAYVKAKDEQEARNKFRDADWYDEETDVEQEDHDWGDAVLNEVQKLDEEAA